MKKRHHIPHTNTDKRPLNIKIFPLFSFWLLEGTVDLLTGLFNDLWNLGPLFISSFSSLKCPTLCFSLTDWLLIDVRQACWNPLTLSTLWVEGLTGYLNIEHTDFVYVWYIQKAKSAKENYRWSWRMIVKCFRKGAKHLKFCSVTLEHISGCWEKKEHCSGWVPLIDSDWRIIRADTQMSPITAGQTQNMKMSLWRLETCFFLVLSCTLVVTHKGASP